MKPESVLTLEPVVTSFLCGASFSLHPGGGAGALRAFPYGQPSACLPKVRGSPGGKGRDERHLATYWVC